MNSQNDIISFDEYNNNNEYFTKYSSIFSTSKDLYSSFHKKLYSFLSTIEDETCQEILQEMEDFTRIFVYIEEIMEDFHGIADKAYVLLQKTEKRKKKITFLKSEKESLKQEISDLQSQMAFSQKDYNALYEDYIKLLSQYNNLVETQKSQIDVSSESFIIKNEQFNKTKEKIHFSEDFIKEMNDKNNSLVKEIKNLKSRISTLVKEKIDLSDKLNKVNKDLKNDYILKSMSELTISKLKNEKVQISKSLNEFKKSVEKLLNDNKNLIQENEKLKAEFSNYKNEPNLNYFNHHSTTTSYTSRLAQKKEPNIEDILKDSFREHTKLKENSLQKDLDIHDSDDDLSSPTSKFTITPQFIINDMNNEHFPVLKINNIKKLNLEEINHQSKYHKNSSSFISSKTNRSLTGEEGLRPNLLLFDLL